MLSTVGKCLQPLTSMLARHRYCFLHKLKWSMCAVELQLPRTDTEIRYILYILGTRTNINWTTGPGSEDVRETPQQACRFALVLIVSFARQDKQTEIPLRSHMRFWGKLLCLLQTASPPDAEGLLSNITCCQVIQRGHANEGVVLGLSVHPSLTRVKTEALWCHNMCATGERNGKWRGLCFKFWFPKLQCLPFF